MPDPNSYRLPRTASPERYEIELTPDLEAASFAGRVEVDLVVHDAVAELVLNAAELDITAAVLTPADGPAVPATVELDEAAERATLHFADRLAPGPARLALVFTGVLNDHLRGFYRSTFVDANGASQVIATTQFESTDARRAFPCWDEPDFKATFAVTLVVPEQLTALSSGAEVESVADAEGRRRVRFAETMKMSTYVLAWVVGPFELTAPVDVDGVPLRLAAPVGRAAMTPFGLDIGSHALRYLSTYFAIPYPSDKIDHVAVPDFAFGAMENLGCVTYRETALLADLDAASQLELMRVAQVVAHETAHMWFGDLVTMRWWNGIWLNEAFATFMELKTTEAYRPDWQVWAAFGGGRAAALATDGLRATRSIEIEVGPPEEAEAMFDVLTYQKGGSVLRMLEQYLGEETFRLGIGRYLRQHAYANTETTDLWDALEAQSGEPVRSTMDSWIFQGGHPLVTVDEGAGASSIVLGQRRFLYAGEGAERWVIPVTLRASVAGEIVERRLLLEEPETVDFGGPVDWVVANAGGWGFYRVSYAPALLARLLDAGPQSVCDPLERMGLVGDTWAEVVNGSADTASWVRAVLALGDERDPDVWSSVAASFAVLDRIVGPTDRPVLQAFVRRVAGPAFASLGWDPVPGESERVGITRSRLLALVGTLGGDEAVQAEAAARLRRFPEDRTALAADLVTSTVAVVAAAGDEATYEMLLDRYRRAATPQDRIRYLIALTGFADPTLLARTLDLALSADVRSQDGPSVITNVLANRDGSELAWTWIEANWPAIDARFPRNMLLRIFEGVAALVDADLVARVHASLATLDLPIRGPRLDQLEERMDVNVALANRVRADLAKVLGAS